MLQSIPTAYLFTGGFNQWFPNHKNCVTGFIGIPGISINCIANYDGARVELYLGMSTKERNKALFDFLLKRKEDIETVTGTALTWSRSDGNKSSKVLCALANVDVSRETDWPRIAQFHTEKAAAVFAAFKKHLEQYFNTAI